MATVRPELSMSISVQQKVRLSRQYEMAEVFVSISGVTPDMTPDQMDEMIEGNGKIAYSKLAAAIKEKVVNLRSDGGFEPDEE